MRVRLVMVDLSDSAVEARIAESHADRLLTSAEAAVYLGLRPQTLAIWRMNRKGPRFVRLNRSVRYRLADLAAYVEAASVDAACI